MKKLSSRRLAQTVAAHRKARKLTQAQLAAATGINRALLSRVESMAYTPSVDQLLALADALAEQIIACGTKLQTGLVGTPYLLHELIVKVKVMHYGESHTEHFF